MVTSLNLKICYMNDNLFYKVSFLLFAICNFILAMILRSMTKQIKKAKSRILYLEQGRTIPNHIEEDNIVMEAMIRKEVGRLFPEDKRIAKRIQAAVMDTIKSDEYERPLTFEDISYMALGAYKLCLDQDSNNLTPKEQFKNQA